MPPPFHRLDLPMFQALVAAWAKAGGRRADSVHMHHTWRPRQTDWAGEPTVEAMWRYHVEDRGFADIAQHVTIGPDGSIWTGRHWNLPPASATGHNGRADAGPFMFEIVGDFDIGRESLEGAQLESVLAVIGTVQEAFGLEVESLRFHRQLGSPKTCPGTAIGYAEIVNAVRQRRARPARPRLAALDAALAGWLAATPAPLAEAECAAGTCPCEPPETGAAAMPHVMGGSRGGDGGKLDAAALTRLRPHVVDLWGGQLSGGGRYRTTLDDIERIFAHHLPERLAALPEGGRLPIVLYAHGGLVNEERGLAIAAKQVPWWNTIGCYPIQFVWETGLLEEIVRLFGRSRDLSRDLSRGLSDFTDPAIEAAARNLGGPRIWRGMKEAAREAFEDDAAGTAVIVRLAAFVKANAGRVSLHGVGHSAGSIFLARLIERLAALKGPRIDSLSFLAPAITVSDHLRLIEPRIPGLVRKLRIFTMTDTAERNDTVTPLYRKSLLYLIDRALEPEPGTPILGQQAAILASPVLKKRLGIGGPASATGEAIWSPTPAATGISLSQSLTHGGFDDDQATMESVACGILGLSAAAELGQRFPAADALPGISPEAGRRGPVAAVRTAAARGTTRRALCIGIDAYPAGNALAGCVADARDWSAALAGLGFEVDTLFDGAATQAGILHALEGMAGAARPGDVLVVQYSGHGTTVEDLDGDESTGQDQAICPVDFEDGRLIIDDDIRSVLHRLPEGVGMTLFMDNCYSFSNTRMAVGKVSPPAGARARRVVLAPETVERYRITRAGMRSRALAPRMTAGGQEAMRWVAFAASTEHEPAWESNGRGDFSRIAVPLLAKGWSNGDFLAAVLDAFGQNRRQTPGLDCMPGQERALLFPFLERPGPQSTDPLPAVSGPAPAVTLPARAVEAASGSTEALADLFDALGRLLRPASQ